MLKKILLSLFALNLLFYFTAISQCNNTLQVSGGQGNYQFSYSVFQLPSSYSYHWDFGDGTTQGSGMNPGHANHSYSSVGTYTVKVTYVDNINGCSISDSIILQGDCYPDFSLKDTNDTVFAILDTISPTSQYNWIWADGSTNNTPLSLLPYSEPGHYTVTVTVTDSIHNCYASSDMGIDVVGSANMNYIRAFGIVNGQPLNMGMAYLVKHDSAAGTLTAVDSISLSGTNPSYAHFANLLAGDYLVKIAADVNSPVYNTSLPTYYTNSGAGALYWANADPITVIDSALGHLINLDLIQGINSGGPGFIGGLISQGANKAGDPIQGLHVLVLDQNGQPVGHRESDNQGEFLIDNLPLGTYRVYPEMEGKVTVPLEVTLTSSNSGANSVRVEVNSDTIFVDQALSVYELNTDCDVQVYPMPVHDFLNITFCESFNSTMDMVIFDAQGNEVLRQMSANSDNLTINTSQLAKGFYVLEIITDSGHQVVRFVK